MGQLFCGIDLGTRASAICVIDADKKVIKRWSGKNQEIIGAIKEFCPGLKCVVEAAPLAESICNLVEEIGSEIEIVDSRHAKAILNGKKKTDRIDAQVLAELAQMGWYKPIHRKTGKCREQRSFLVARAHIVQSSTSIKNSIRGIFKANGKVLTKGGTGLIFLRSAREAMKELPPLVQAAINQLLICWVQLHRSERAMYSALRKVAQKDATASILMSVPGVGPATAIGFASTIATHTRFKNKKKVASYLGLAPKVYQSGDSNYHGRITKKGDSLLRWLLTEAAHSILTRTTQSFPLKEWGLALVQRKGIAKAKVALARKLSELLFTIWKTQKAFVVA